MSIYRCTECAGIDGTICHANTAGICKKGSPSAKPWGILLRRVER